MPEGPVTLFITHSNLTSMSAETKLPRTMTIGKLRDRLYMSTGTAPSAQALTLQDATGTPVAMLDDDTKTLGFYFPEDGMLLHVVDTDPSSISAGGALEDTSAVKKFELSKDEYDSQGGAKFRAFRAARLKKKEGATKIDDSFQKDEAAALTVGSRCQLVKSGRRGEIMYVGLIPEIKPGFWVGVKLDEPSGKNDGSVKGTSYFPCEPNFGCFSRPKGVEQGDFPELDLLTDDDEM